MMGSRCGGDDDDGIIHDVMMTVLGSGPRCGGDDDDGDEVSMWPRSEDGDEIMMYLRWIEDLKKIYF